ncbi:transcriptional regulator, TetR family [Litoreibacter ascidiaceicola]|uniref:Transcriptional regulator, TetR family n=1 Tax=Litoreibacter ascidiaceicola TaxID=1486859 RepID=A0A1M5EL22_9RHOB|nr:TetR/AcrR family transcriptional regulator [Litoreibacter ascidiaceicola]SHF79939.1 transcriptional regulator, TetR family [Litoreibacter ascidiaceicola]
MTARITPLLHRDDPDKDPLVGHVKVTREDWLNVARDVLVSDGVAEVKVLALGTRLDVSRSSFYGYFKSRKHLLEVLLDDWENRNTRTILENTQLPAASITESVCNFFRCFLDPDLFDRGLDFAVREWSRREGRVRQRIDAADATRLRGISAMYERHGYSDYDADTRARILYFMQLGYHALEVLEPIDARMARIEGYLRGFTGVEPDIDTVTAFRSFVDGLNLK